MSIKKKVGRRFFIIANWMLSLQIITLPEEYLEFFSQILVNETLDSNEIEFILIIVGKGDWS